MIFDRVRRAGVASLVVLFAACEVEKVGIPRTESMVSLHGVLSASASTQVVLLERTRNGSVRMFAPPFDLADPIVSDEGVAESGAIVNLTTPDGQTLFATEDKLVRSDRKGEGIYRFSLPGSALDSYYLLVTWATVVSLVRYLRFGVPPVWEKAPGTR